MESSKSLGAAEEYSSNESGWTMYIDDSIHGNDQSDVVDDDDHEDYQSTDEQRDNHVKNSIDDDDNDEESDDSMASDASSGPSHQLPNASCKHSSAKYSSKPVHDHQQMKKRGEKAVTAEKEEPALKTKSRITTSHVQSGGKAKEKHKKQPGI